MERTVADVTIELVQGDITRQTDVRAIANAANAMLLPGGGVAGAIHNAAGPGLAEECRPLGPIRPGQAVITSGHDLPNDYVVHCLGPVYGKDKPAAELLTACHRSAIRLVEDAGVESIAFPAISTGVFGYPIEEAAEVALRAVVDVAPRLGVVRLVRFVLWAETDLRAFERALERLA